MALQVGELYAILRLEDSQFHRGLAGARGAFSALGAGLVGIASSAVAQIGAVFSAGLVAQTGIAYNAMMEQSEIAWSTILGDAKEASETIARLQEMGAKTPFEFEDLDKAAKLLNMAGYEGENLYKTLTNVGDAVSAIGGSGEDLQAISMAIFQMATKGKISAEEMNQLAERGIPAWDMVAQAMGVSTQEVMKMSENGKLFAKDVLPMLTEQLGKRFGGAMQKQSQTFNGLMSTLKDNAKIAAGVITKDLFEKIKTILPPIIDILNRFIDAFQAGGWEGALKEFLPPSVAQGVINTLGMIKGAFEGIKSFIVGWVNYVKNAFSGEGGIGSSLGKIFDALKTVALPVLQDAISFIKQKFGEIKQFWDQNGQQIIQAVQNVWQGIAAIIQFVAPIVAAIVKGVWENIKGIIDGALKVIMGIVKVFAGLFTGDFSKMWEGIKQIFIGAVKVIWNWINLMFLGKMLGVFKSAGKGMLSVVKDIWTGVKVYFTNLWRSAVQIVSNLKNGVIGYFTKLKDQAGTIFQMLRQLGESRFKALWNTVKSMAVNIYHDVKNAFSNALKSVQSAVTDIWNAVKGGFSKAVSAVGSAMSGILSAIKGGFSRATSAVASAVSGILSKLKGMASGAVSAGRDLMLGLARGIGNAVGSVISKAKQVAGQVVSTVKKAFGIHSPSRVMRDQVGKQVGAGLAVGISKSTKHVTKAASKQAKAAQQAYQKRINEKIANLETKYNTGQISGKSFINQLKYLQKHYKLTDAQARRVQRDIYTAQQRLSKAATVKVNDMIKNLENKYKTGKMDAQAFIKSLQNISKQYRLTSAQKLTINKDIYMAQQQLKNQTAKVNKGIKAANDKYYKSVKTINDNLAKSIQNVKNEYNKQLQELTNSIYSQLGLFDEATRLYVSPQRLMKNIKDQIALMQQFQNDINKLASSGAPKAFVDELRQMGYGAANEIHAIANMPKEMLDEYIKQWQLKHSLAAQEANAQMADERAAMEAQIRQLTLAAQKELANARSTWISEISKLGTEVAKLGSFRNSGQVLGKDTVAGIINGLKSMSGPLASAAKSIAQTIEKTIKSTLKIKSPSRVMMALGSFVGQGLAKGIYGTLGLVSNMAGKLSQAAMPNIGAIPSIAPAMATMNYSIGGAVTIEVPLHVDGKRIASALARYNSRALYVEKRGKLRARGMQV